MVVTIKIGRRLPRKGMERIWKGTTRFLSGQEHLWMLITQSFNLAKKEAAKKPDEEVFIHIEKKEEKEDMYAKLEWCVVTITSKYQEKEQEEYDETMKLFDKLFSKQLKGTFEKTIDENEKFAKPFKTKILNFNKIKEAGFKYATDKSFVSIFNEFEIVIDVEKDF